MPTRFDHAVIAVRDLDVAMDRFQHLGFAAGPGGRHADGGTHNGLIRFGLDYIELLAVYDQALARAQGSGTTLLDTLNGREAALVGYALATETIEEDAARFVGAGSQPAQLRVMGRTRPDGARLSWRIAVAGKTFWQRPGPFLIQWDTPDAVRLQIETPGRHANGARGWRQIDLAVRDLDRALDLYQHQLGLELVKRDVSVAQAANRALLRVGQGLIELLSPTGDGAVQQTLSDAGEGPFALSFAVDDLAVTRAYLEQQKIGFFTEATGTGRIELDPRETFGLSLSFRAEQQ